MKKQYAKQQTLSAVHDVRHLGAVLAAATLALAFGWTNSTQASLLDFQGQYGSELEENSAIANQQTYDELLSQGCTDIQSSATTSCSSDTYLVWENVRELVHTANELSNNGESTLFSLDSDLEGLGFALRWTAGEEFSSEESLTNSFVNGQLSGLASRITALRSGARGFNISGFSVNDEAIASSGQGISGKNAGDETNDAWTRLGGFLNGTYTFGDQGPTERQDAYDFDGQEINAGVDYRLDNHWVVGAILGYQKSEIDFDSSQSIVDGTVQMDAFSVTGFFLYQSDRWFYSGSLGAQTAEFETSRSIRYPSVNPNVANVDTVAISTNDADIITINMSTGYSFRPTQSFTLEPTFSINYQDILIEEYSEEDIENEGFSFIVGEQKFESMETVVGLKFQYVISSTLGVFIPYADASLYTQHKETERYINATYVGAADSLSADAAFSLPTDGIDKDYKIYTIGLSSVIRGARQTEFGTAASGGIQVYVNYRQIEDIGDYNQKIISGGLRYEF